MHLVNQIKHHKLSKNNVLHIIGVIQNPVRYHSRYRLFQKWIKEMCALEHVQVHVVEAVYGDREPECAPTVLNYNYKMVRITSEIWLKENLINLAVRDLLPRNWQYMAWVDCDVHFRNNDWVQGTLHALQHYHVVQPWSHAIDLDFHGGIHKAVTSFGHLSGSKKPMRHGGCKEPYSYAHPGYAWACTRYWYENVEKLLDICIIGSGDNHMAWGCLGHIKETIHGSMHQDYFHHCYEWQRKARRACGGVVGYVSGIIEHNFHGPKERRNYWGRWDVLRQHKFNPKNDLAYDEQGVLVLCSHDRHLLEHDVMLYNRARLEDSIEMY